MIEKKIENSIEFTNNPWCQKPNTYLYLNFTEIYWIVVRAKQVTGKKNLAKSYNQHYEKELVENIYAQTIIELTSRMYTMVQWELGAHQQQHMYRQWFDIRSLPVHC